MNHEDKHVLLDEIDRARERLHIINEHELSRYEHARTPLLWPALAAIAAIAVAAVWGIVRWIAV